MGRATDELNSSRVAAGRTAPPLPDARRVLDFEPRQPPREPVARRRL